MRAQLKTEEKVIPPTLEGAAVKVKIAADLVQCLWMAAHLFDDDGERGAMVRVSDFAILNLMDALDIIGDLMAEDGK